MLEHFHSLLQEIVSDPGKPVSTLSLLSETERQQLLVYWNQTRNDYPRELCIHELFQEQVNRTPDAIAVQFEDKSLTYKELGKRANELAMVLVSQGVKPGKLVGIFVNRSMNMLVGLLGVLKAGGAYLPLDPSFPSKRLAFMVKIPGHLLFLPKQPAIRTA